MSNELTATRGTTCLAFLGRMRFLVILDFVTKFDFVIAARLIIALTLIGRISRDLHFWNWRSLAPLPGGLCQLGHVDLIVFRSSELDVQTDSFERTTGRRRRE